MTGTTGPICSRRCRRTAPHLWRAVDQHGNVLDVLIQSRRNSNAAIRFFRKLLKRLEYVPRVIVTDKLDSYQVRTARYWPRSSIAGRSI
jgi:transposase-like protein